MRTKGKSTKYITMDSRKCEACWDCLEECEYNVLGKINLWFHKHVVITHAENCRGCKRCISACPNNVFEPVTQTRIEGQEGGLS